MQTAEPLSQLTAELDRRLFELHALHKAAEALHQVLEVDRLSEMLVAMIQERASAETIAILLGDSEVDPLHLAVRAVSGLPKEVCRLAFQGREGILWRLLVAGDPISMVDRDGTPRFREVFDVQGLAELRGTVWLPMVLGGTVVGIVSLGSTRGGPAAPDLDFVAALVNQAAVAFSTAMLYERNTRARRELNRSLHQLSMLFDVTRALGAVQDLTALVRLILDRAVRAVNAERGSLMLLDEATQELVVRVVHGLPDPEAERRINEGEVACARFKRGEGVAGRVLETRLPSRVNDTGADSEFQQRQGSNVRSILCVPLLVDDECIGVLNFSNRRGDDAFTAEDERISMALGQQAATAIARTRLYEAAITDGLTGIYVRRFGLHRLGEEARRATRHDAPLSVILCDVDHFKSVNDTHGHPAGDAVLAAVATTLKKGLRTSDIPSRYGGEEFLLVLPHTALAEATAAAERLRRAIEALEIGASEGKQLRVTMSFGVAQYDRTTTTARLIEEADAALYRAKHEGRNRVVAAQENAAESAA